MNDNPNVLLICTDHWPGYLLGSAGHPVVETPTLDELARAGVRYHNTYSECPVCIPARRTLMTGTSPRSHGDRIFKEEEPMPDFPLLAQTFRDAGYQAYASGKLHVYPQRDRIGFDDVMLNEEGRAQWGVMDDYEAFLGSRGYPGQQFGHGMSNNQYMTRPWHLPEDCHNTNWTASQMERFIRRRDPGRPAFWYLSFAHPHPPLAPLPFYLEMYRRDEIPAPVTGSWAVDRDRLPHKLRENRDRGADLSARAILEARRAFYALCTHIDHQIRRVIGAIREEGLIKNTIIMFTSDHGDMLGTHGLWAKRCFLDPAARVPLILSGPPVQSRAPAGSQDSRLVGWADIMPTLLDLCGLPIPDSVDGLSMVADQRRTHLYGEEGDGAMANRMVRDDRHKLIYYPCGNRKQLFDMTDDPEEMTDLAESPDHTGIVDKLTDLLVSELYGEDKSWIRDGVLVGLPDEGESQVPSPGLAGQRGSHWPPPPKSSLSVEV